MIDRKSFVQKLSEVDPRGRGAPRIRAVRIRLLPPANVVCEGYVFTRVCHSFCSWGGVRGCSQGGMCGCCWGGMCGCSGGVCVVALGGHVWFYSGDAWFYSGGMHGFIWGCAWFYLGGVHGFIWGDMRGFFSFIGYNEIRSMSGQYASYWNAFLF